MFPSHLERRFSMTCSVDYDSQRCPSRNAKKIGGSTGAVSTVADMEEVSSWAAKKSSLSRQHDRQEHRMRQPWRRDHVRSDLHSAIYTKRHIVRPSLPNQLNAQSQRERLSTPKSRLTRTDSLRLAAEGCSAPRCGPRGFQGARNLESERALCTASSFRPGPRFRLRS